MSRGSFRGRLLTVGFHVGHLERAVMVKLDVVRVCSRWISRQAGSALRPQTLGERTRYAEGFVDGEPPSV